MEHSETMRNRDVLTLRPLPRRADACFVTLTYRSLSSQDRQASASKKQINTRLCRQLFFQCLPFPSTLLLRLLLFPTFLFPGFAARSLCPNMLTTPCAILLRL